MRNSDDTVNHALTAVRLQELARDAAAGDAEAFASIYDSTCPQVHGMVSRMLCDDTAAERVTESTYVRAFAEIATGGARRTGVLAWLLDLAHIEALVQIRQQMPQQREARVLAALSDDEAGDALPVTGLRGAMSQLTGSQRRSLHLAYYGGFEHAEVSTLLGLPTGAASVRMSDGLRALRDHLETAGLMEPLSA